VDLEWILGHQPDGAGDATRAFLLTLDGIVVVGQVWSGHLRIMGRCMRATGAARRTARASRRRARILVA
jgi:hypothetical protein